MRGDGGREGVRPGGAGPSGHSGARPSGPDSPTGGAGPPRGARRPDPVLDVRGLTTRFDTNAGTVHAVSDVSFALAQGEALALVGESGSGKSVTALSLLGLVPPPGRIVAGDVRLRGRSLLGGTARDWQSVRGREIAMVFQDPMTSLNPVLRVGYQVAEPMRRHLGLSRRDARARTADLLRQVGIPDPLRRLDDYPHEFSGGQRQRIMIAMALACGPSVLVADEPTTALDVTVQAQIVALVRDLQEELGMAILWITHDLGLVAGLVDRVAVMYAGRIVEEGPVATVYADPRHPYTRGLLASLPDMAAPPVDRLAAIDGRPPDLRALPPGCAFEPRCGLSVRRCVLERPPLMDAGPRHVSACWRHDELDEAVR